MSAADSFACGLCDCSFSSQESLMSHNQFHVKEECKPSIPEETEALVSDESSTNDAFHDYLTDMKQECSISEIASQSNETLKQKFSNVDDEVERSVLTLWRKKRYFICNKCSRKCKDQESLSEHYKLHITREEGKDISYDSYYSYSLTQPRASCNLCEVKFKTETKSERKKHFYEFHNRSFPFNCCNMKFRKLKEMLEHTRLCHSDKLIKCDICHKGFLRNKDLNSHYKIHRGENSRDWYTGHAEHMTVVKGEPELIKGISLGKVNKI